MRAHIEGILQSLKDRYRDLFLILNFISNTIGSFGQKTIASNNLIKNGQSRDEGNIGHKIQSEDKQNKNKHRKLK